MEEFEGWYEREHQRVFRACLVLGGNADLASEATDEAFARALERWPAVSRMVAPGAWVQVVALNHLRHTLRRRRWERQLAPRPVQAAELALPYPEVWVAIRRLPPRQQTAVVLRYVGDLPEADIAAAMGTTRGNVARTLHDAREQLRHRLDVSRSVAKEMR